MNIESLKCFCAVVQTGSFIGAARRLHRSQPAISQQLKALEKQLGHTLVDRKTGEATAAGLLLYDRAQEILLELDALQRTLGDFEAGVQREFRIGASDTTALYILPPYLRRFRASMPETRLVMISRSSDAIADMVLAGEVDLGIVTLPLGRAGLEEQPLFQQRLVLALPAGHPLAAARELPLQALADEPLVLLAERTRTGAIIYDYFRAHDFTPRVALDSGSFEVIKRYVREGLGCAILPEQAVSPGEADIVARPLPGLPAASVGAIRRRRAQPSPAEKALLAIIADTPSQAEEV